MKKIEIVKAYIQDDTIRYDVCEEPGLGLLQREKVELFIRFHFADGFDLDFRNLPLSIIILPISLYLIPITYFYKVEVVIPEMDEELYNRLPQIYEAYSKLYGPFRDEWRGKVTVRKIVANKFVGDTRYDRVVFFSGGVDACHAGIANAGSRSLLVTIPDIETMAKNEGPLREEKFSLIKDFAQVVGSDWLLIENNFNLCLLKNQEINRFLKINRRLDSPAFRFDGWGGIKYVANMCCVAPVAYCFGVRSLVMGSTCEEIEGVYAENLDGVNPKITNAFKFAGISFAEQDGLLIRRTKKVSAIIEWCQMRGKMARIWACFSDRSAQCGFCGKCVRTQLNILCAGENPKCWGFSEYDGKKFARFIKAYKYRENPCWLWDNIEAVDEKKKYPHQDDLLHWLKKVGYKKYLARAEARANPSVLRKLLSIWRYPHYLRTLAKRIAH